MIALVLALSCSLFPAEGEAGRGSPSAGAPEAPAELPKMVPGQESAVFAGGCFWCLESDFDKLPGVVATVSGYTGGRLKSPTYEAIGRHDTGHYEAVYVVYDTTKLDYAQVLDWFWHHIDPTDAGGQFCDRGEPYRTAVFYQGETQRAVALGSIQKIEASGALTKPVVTEVLALAEYWPAENYHQDFHLVNPARYLPYRMGCGRDSTVARVWGK